MIWQTGRGEANVVPEAEDAEDRNQNLYHELQLRCSTLGLACHDCRMEDAKNRGIGEGMEGERSEVLTAGWSRERSR
jgi:hypothetical protein